MQRFAAEQLEVFINFPTISGKVPRSDIFITKCQLKAQKYGISYINFFFANLKYVDTRLSYTKTTSRRSPNCLESSPEAEIFSTP